MKRKILFVISNIDYSLGFEWLADYLNKDRFELNFVFLNSCEPALIKIINALDVKTFYIPYSGKKDIAMATFQIFKIILKFRPDTVHAHLFDACLISLPLARLAGVKQRLYTRHHSTFHHVYHPGMVKYDRFINRQCTHIVAISENVADVLRNLENIPAEKIWMVYHGFDIEAFKNPDPTTVTRLIGSLNIDRHYPVIGVISRYTEWKGIQYIIPAFKKILEVYPNAKLVLANAKGDYAGEIKAMLSNLPADSYAEIGFEMEIFSLYSLFNIFVHVPIDAESEAFGQTYVEALAAGIPSIFTLSGISREFIVDKYNALVVPFKDSDAVVTALFNLLNNPDLCEKIRNAGRNDVSRLYPIKKMINSLEALYAKEA